MTCCEVQRRFRFLLRGLHAHSRVPGSWRKLLDSAFRYGQCCQGTGTGYAAGGEPAERHVCLPVCNNRLCFTTTQSATYYFKVARTDTDLDGFVDSEDNCPDMCNTQQKDADGDGIGDVCDTAPWLRRGAGSPNV